MIVTVSKVADAAVTVPAAPRLRTTALAEGVDASKPVPVTVIFAEFLATFVAVSDTVGLATIVATCTHVAPLETPKDVTIAVRFPGVLGGVLKVSTSDVVVADETVAATTGRLGEEGREIERENEVQRERD